MSNHDLRLLRSNGAEQDQVLGRRNLLPPTGLVTHPSLGLALGLPPGSLPPHLPPGYTTSGQLPVGQPTSGRLIGQSQKPTTGRVQPITNPSQKQAASETGKKLGKNQLTEQAKQVLNKQELEKQLQYQLQQQQIFYLNAFYAQQLQASVLDRRYHIRSPGLHLAPGVAVPGVPTSSAQSAGLRPEHFSGLSVGPNYGLAEMQRRIYMTQNENILRAMSNQSAVDPGASGQSSRTAVVRGALDQPGHSPDTTPGVATKGFSPSGSAFTPVTPKVKKDNPQRLPIPTGVSGQIKSKQRCASVPVLKSTEEIKDFPFRWDKKPEITGLVGQIPLKLNKSLELGSSLPTPPPTHPIINQSGLSQSELPINVDDASQPIGVTDESNVENQNLPQRGVVLIKAYPDSSTSPASISHPPTNDVTLVSHKPEIADDEMAKKYSNCSLPAKKRKLFADQSESSIPQSPMSLSPTPAAQVPPTHQTGPLPTTVPEPSAPPNGENENRVSVIMANREAISPEVQYKPPEAHSKTPEAKPKTSEDLQVQSEEVSSSNLPVIPSEENEEKPEVEKNRPEVVKNTKISSEEKVKEEAKDVEKSSEVKSRSSTPTRNEPIRKIDQSERDLTKRTISEEMQPLKKRRLKAVIADALNQNLEDYNSSNYSSRNISPIQLSIASDSDTLPLAVIRDRLNQQNRMPPIKIHACDKYNPLEVSHIESSLLTFKSHVSTPSTMSAPSSPPSSVPPSPPTVPKNITNSMSRVENSTRRIRPNRRPSHPFANMDAEELEQLAPYMGLSGSDSDVKGDDSSESDDEFQSRAQIESGSERRKTRSPSVSPYRPTQTGKPPTQTQPGRKRKKKKRKSSEHEPEDGPEDNGPDIPEDHEENPEDDHLAKFFAADAELSDHNENVTSSMRRKEKSKIAKKKKKTEDKKNDIKSQKTVKKSSDSPKTSSGAKNTDLKELNSRKRKSGTPRKLEVIDETKMDSWETAEDTEIVKNSSNDKDYLIKEHDASWYSVTCFCGQPFAGRPMIECEMCGIWVHMTCAKIKKTKIPEHYNCITCRRDSKAVKTRFRK